MANDGGPAFPSKFKDVSGEPFVFTGMTLRDYFAAKALAGGIREFFSAGDAWDGYEDFAESCYHMADAMLKARER